MGGVKNAALEARDKKRTAAAERRAEKRRQQGQMDVAAIPWDLMVALIAEMAASGGAVRVGLTRDGGALALGMYHGDDYATEYMRPNEDLEAGIYGIADLWLPDGLLGLERQMARMGIRRMPPEQPK